MTADMIARRIKDAANFDRIMVPGLCRGDLAQLSEKLALEVIRGPIDVKDLPQFFGRDMKPGRI